MRRSWPCLLSIFAYSLALSASAVWAGPVNSRGSYPYAQLNTRADRLTLGDLKGLVSWQEQGSMRTAALHWSHEKTENQRFTGGLAESEARRAENPAAIACSDQETHLFYPERSPTAPAGLWRAAGNTALFKGLRRCTMLSDGQFAEFFPDNHLILVNRKFSFSLPHAEADAELLAADQTLVILSPKGQAWSLIQDRGHWQLRDAGTHPFGNFSPTTRFAANHHLILRADPEGNDLAVLQNTAEGLQIQDKTRLPVNPCEGEQVCGLSLAHDDSWMLSGYWGHYLGIGLRSQRLKIPLSLDKGPGGVAIAHSGNKGTFVYLGWDDGDQGSLPQLAIKDASSPRHTSSTEAYMVWEKPGFQAQQKLLAVPLLLKTRAQESRSTLMRIHQGPLPQPIPQHWVAWEAAAPFSPPELDASHISAADDRWWLDSLGAVLAQKMAEDAGLNASPIHVAVIDSGIAMSHPLLQLQLDRNLAEQPDNGIDDDGNGYIDDQWGYDFVEEDAHPQDQFGHGTHVAGLMMAGSQGDLRNPSPNLKLKVIRALDKSGKSNSIDLARALIYAAENGAELINCSWGGGPDTQALRDSFAYLKSKGIVVFASAGNNTFDTDKRAEVPKNYPGVYSIAAFDQGNHLASFSNYGQHSVRFLSPGDAIVSTTINGQLGEKSGTSMAAPIATASFAYLWGLWRSLHPDTLVAEQVQAVDQLLCLNADKKGLEKRSQCGRLRLDRAVQQLLTREQAY